VLWLLLRHKVLRHKVLRWWQLRELHYSTTRRVRLDIRHHLLPLVFREGQPLLFLVVPLLLLLQVLFEQLLLLLKVWTGRRRTPPRGQLFRWWQRWWSRTARCHGRSGRGGRRQPSGGVFLRRRCLFLRRRLFLRLHGTGRRLLVRRSGTIGFAFHGQTQRATSALKVGMGDGPFPFPFRRPRKLVRL